MHSGSREAFAEEKEKSSEQGCRTFGHNSSEKQQQK
jgi:hypothetical protein